VAKKGCVWLCALLVAKQLHSDPSSSRRLQLAQLHQESGDWLSAAASYTALAELHPHDHRFLVNQGNALWLADLPAAAHEVYLQAAELDPSCLVARRGLASCLRDLNRFEEALTLHQQLEGLLEHSSADALANLWAHSQVLIGLERYGDAFQRMLWRRSWEARSPEPAWDPLARRLTLTTEQGFGDSLQFVRFLLPLQQRRLAADRLGGVQLLVEPALVDLLREGLSWLVNPPEVLAVATSSEHARAPRNALSLLELPGALALDQLPQIRADGSYLYSPRWSAQPPHPSAARGPFQVGVVSEAGRPGADPFCQREFDKRSLPMAILWRLMSELRACGAEIYDLQYGAEATRHRALGLKPLPAGPGLTGFAATARQAAGLDLVISVDTAMAHLMGAIGRSCWVLLPWSADPRWLRRGDGCPWYPRLRLFRQPRPGDWHGALDQLLECFTPIRFAQDRSP
jgi:tetratricopeptide (TPR) repeat protein